MPYDIIPQANRPREAALATAEGHDLADAGAGEVFAAGDGGLAFDLASVELALPFLGEAQELRSAGGAALLWQSVPLRLALQSAVPGRGERHKAADRLGHCQAVQLYPVVRGHVAPIIS